MILSLLHLDLTMVSLQSVLVRPKKNVCVVLIILVKKLWTVGRHEFFLTFYFG